MNIHITQFGSFTMFRVPDGASYDEIKVLAEKEVKAVYDVESSRVFQHVMRPFTNHEITVLVIVGSISRRPQ